MSINTPPPGPPVRKDAVRTMVGDQPLTLIQSTYISHGAVKESYMLEYGAPLTSRSHSMAKETMDAIVQLYTSLRQRSQPE